MTRPSASIDGVFLPSACRDAERIAREESAIPEDELVERASLGAWKIFKDLVPGLWEFAVVCGPGANGADGLALARHAREDGFRPTVLLVGREPPAGGAFARQLERLQPLGVPASRWTGAPNLPADAAAVDAMYGTGLSRPLQGDALDASRWLSARRTLALDIPSGLDGATGRPLGDAVRALATATFGRSKPGLHLHPGREHVGAIHLVDIGIPPSAWAKAGSPIGLLDDRWASKRLAPRPRGAHKGDAGRVFLLCGSDAYPGAAILCTTAALRSGAGLLFVGSTESVVQRLPLAVPEAIALDAMGPGADPDLFASRVAESDALLAGPGLGQGDTALAALRSLLALARSPLVLDADALNLLSLHADLRESFAGLARTRGAVVTPHPGEASRLLGRPVAGILSDPIGGARDLATRLGCVAILKTATPVVASPAGELAIGIAGHSGMAVGGCGDALAGAVAARLAEGVEPFEAACQSVRAHARAGDLAGAKGRRGMSVTDLVSRLPDAWEEMEA